MALGPRLDLRQSQSLVMTPQLQQAIRLLALSNLEIESYISEELDKNPLLEAVSDDRNDRAETDGSDADGADADGSGPGDRELPALSDQPGGADELIERGVNAADTLDIDLGSDTFHHDSIADRMGEANSGGPGLDGGLGLAATGGGGSEDGIDFDAFSAPDIGLADHLIAQAGEALSGVHHAVALYLIDQIDPAGYLDADLLDVANRLGVPLHIVEEALAAIHRFDPAGVGARSLSECLAIQAKEADRYDPCMAVLIANLDLVAKGALAQLKRICGVDDEDMADMIRELRSYDPKPGLCFGSEAVQAVVPDLFVEQRKTGWAVEVNGATLPKLLVNRSYYAELAGGARTAESKGWLSEHLANANWVIRALDQRQRTIIKVAAEIVKQQEGFFLHGVSHLKPLTLRSIAEAIEMHESTVSRVTSNKYLSCARGLFELKYFFTSGIQAADGGEAVSATAVKAALKALIEAEDAAAILSDEKLAELLKVKGFDISRRTVVKYRESMGLGSSVQRRRQKALAG